MWLWCAMPEQSNITGIAPETAAKQAAHLIRYAMAIQGMDRMTYAGWLRRIAADLEAEETRQ